MSSVIFHPQMTLQQMGEIVEASKLERGIECYIRVESIAGKPVAYLVREPRIPTSNVGLLRPQAG